MCSHTDDRCECFKIVEEIDEKFPDSDWNCDAACSEWRERSSELKDNNIEFEEFSDECYGCTCPTCGRLVCGWCV